MDAAAAALAHILATLAAIAPTHEGLRDFARLNLKAETLLEIRAAIDQYDRRVAKLIAAQTALELLLADGHPTLTPRPMNAAALEDLRENTATLDAALALFGTGPAPASRLNLAVIGIEPKAGTP